MSYLTYTIAVYCPKTLDSFFSVLGTPVFQNVSGAWPPPKLNHEVILIVFKMDESELLNLSQNEYTVTVNRPKTSQIASPAFKRTFFSKFTGFRPQFRLLVLLLKTIAISHPNGSLGLRDRGLLRFGSLCHFWA